jgi:hypothetical protein
MTAMYQIANGKAPPIASHIPVSDAVTAFLSACCAVDPLQRYSVDLLLAHPFVTQSYSDDKNLIVITDEEECLDSDLPSINEDSQPSPPMPSPSRSPNKSSGDQLLEPNPKAVNPERAELTFKSRIPILQGRGMKVNVDSPDLPAKKSIEEQVTPSIYKLRKTRPVETTGANLSSAPAIQPPLMTPTPPTGERTNNNSTKFRKQASRGLVAAATESESTNTPKNLVDSPTPHFSDQELSPVNHFSPGPLGLTRDESVPQLQSMESIQYDLDQETKSTALEMLSAASVPVDSSNPPPTVVLDDEGISPQKVDHREPEPVIQSKVKSFASPQHTAALSSPQNKSTPPSASLKKKKDNRYDSFTAPNREKIDFLEDSDDGSSAILINGSLMNSKGSLVEVRHFSSELTTHLTLRSRTKTSDQLRLCRVKNSISVRTLLQVTSPRILRRNRCFLCRSTSSC